VPTVLAQVDRDRDVWLEWIAGKRQTDLARERGVSQQAVSQAIARYRATLPTLDRQAELDRTLDLVNELLLVQVPRARNGHQAATRLVKDLLSLKVRLAGLDAPARVEHGGTIEHQHAVTVVEPLDAVVARILARQGRPLPGQLTRPDQNGHQHQAADQDPAVVEAAIVEEVERDA
jgi:hypothetical protein